jgi:hypothetical protein
MTTKRISRTAAILNLLSLAGDLTGPPEQSERRSNDDSGDGHYQSPTWGWHLRFDPVVWKTQEVSSTYGVDTLVLASCLQEIPSPRVTFRTGTPQRRTLRDELVNAAKHLASLDPGTTLDIAYDSQGKPILEEIGNGRHHDHGHWVGSYILGHASEGDRIVEFDAFSINNHQGVVIVQAVTLPPDYDDAFHAIDRLRSGLAFGGVSLFDLGEEESAASRPRVQY